MSDTSSDVQIIEELNYKSISCFQIPEAFLDKLIAKEHFGQFGRITRFILRTSRFSCTVEYDNTQSAENAMKNGKTYKGYLFNIKYTPQEIVKPKLFDPDPDVQDELNAMSGGTSKPMNKMPNPLEQFIKQNRTERLPAAQYAYKSLSNRGALIQLPAFSLGPTAPPPKPSIDSSIRSNAAAMQARTDLEAVASKPAVTAEDKFKVLDLRDKYLRHIMVRNTDIKKAQSTKGTCSDMCPEKERWMREAKMQIASYEYLGDTSHIDQQRAVKQYSRSSADQETPMPHELRSEKGLKLTMLYLLHNIVGMCDDAKTNLSDWFHFVWDRTRSIRKDITQQELCSSEAVELIEQCARFHIHCSARLISEDPSVFDHKINTENLTKCLQSLKYMYDDLELKGVQCKNESEFRAYVVLLNLNDGNFLWEIKQLPAAVAKSPEVRFALDIYFAIENNNYVKFFQLVRRTSYMNACILLRYFNQVRCKALEIMVKAFASRAPVNFTISHFTDLLAFEDDDNACCFLEYYGLTCDRSQDSVTLDKRFFEFPDMPFILDRAMRVVESKRTKSTGEVICGSALEPIELINRHVVHCSFTREGYLKEDSWLAEDQNGKIQRRSDVTDFRDSSARVTSPVVDEHVFKKPAISPPISPKTVLASTRGSVINRLGTRAEPVKDQPTIFGKPALEAISGITPIFSKKPDNSATSIFSSSSTIFAPVPSATPITVTPSIFGGSATSQQPAVDSKNIFGSAFSTIVKPVIEPAPSVYKPSNSGSIFGGTQFLSPTIGRNIFALPATPSSRASLFEASPQSSASSIFDSPAQQADEESLSDSGTESDQLVAVPSPKWSQDSDDENDVDEEEEEEDYENDNSFSRKQQEMDIRRKLEEKLELEKKKQEAAERISIKSEEIFQQLLDEITKSETETVTDDLLKHYKALQMIPERVFDDVLNEIILNEVLDVALEETVMKQVNLKMMRRHFQKWRVNARESIDRMHKIAKTPCWLPDKPMKEQVQEFLHPSQDLNLFYMTRYLKGSPLILKYPTEKTKQIDIFNIVASKIFTKQATACRHLGANSHQQFWKLAISTPFKNEENKSDFYNYIDKFLAKNFRSTDDKVPVSSTKRDVFFLQQNFCQDYRKTLSICVRQVRGKQLINEFNETASDCVENSNALLFFMTALASKEVSRDRLHRCLQTAEQWGPVPLAIVVYESTIEHITVSKIVDQLDIEGLLEQEKITDYEIIFHSTQQLLQQSIETGIQYLAKNYSFENCLEMQSQLSFLSICLGDELWMRFELSKEQNQTFAVSTTNPNFVIELYNQAIQRVINIVSHDFQPYPDFPCELRKFVPKKTYDIPLSLEYFPVDWKSRNRQLELCIFLESSKLPTMKTDTFSSFATLDAEINSYVHHTIKDDRNAAKVSNLMIQYLLSALEYAPSESFADISWTAILKVLANETLQENWQKFNQRMPSDIVYKQTELESYSRTAWWLTDKHLTKWCKNVRAQRPRDKADEPDNKRPRLQSSSSSLVFTKEQLEEILSKGELTMKRATERIDRFKEVASETREVSKHFDHTLYRQEKQFHEYRRVWEENLQC